MPADRLDDLMLDLLEWLAVRPRALGDVLEAWGTSCPGLPVLEETEGRGLARRSLSPEGTSLLAPTAAGLRWLESQRSPGPDARAGGGARSTAGSAAANTRAVGR